MFRIYLKDPDSEIDAMIYEYDEKELYPYIVIIIIFVSIILLAINIL